MEADFPAAHSMSTAWFAVDRDGHVAYFYSGESGAVPRSGGDVAVDEAVERLMPTGTSLQDPDGRWLASVRWSDSRHVAPSDHEPEVVRYVLAFLPSPDPVREWLDAGQARVLPARSGVAVYFEQMPRPLFVSLHDKELCQGCFLDYGGPHLPEYSPGRFGLFVYDHLCENWISGPYGRQAVPQRPVHVEQLPPAVREAVSRVRFDLSFAETPHLQPLEHVECDSWEEDYLTLDGRRFSMSGEELPPEDDE